MGITIFYKGKLNNMQHVNSVVDELNDISEIMNWEKTILDNDWNQPNTAELIRHENRIDITGHIPLKGIRINLHPDCEPLSIFFDKQGNLQDILGMVLNHEENEDSFNRHLSVKTQFASPNIHISIIKLLKFLKNKYISDLDVFDEGGYWETENQELLEQKINFINEKLDKVEEIITTIQEDLSRLPREEAIKLLEKTLRDRLK